MGVRLDQSALFQSKAAAKRLGARSATTETTSPSPTCGHAGLFTQWNGTSGIHRLIAEPPTGHKLGKADIDAALR